MSNVYEEFYEYGREDGLNEGKEIGLNEGKEIGMKKGMRKGMKKKSIEIAKKLLLLGLSIEVISQTTDLIHEEIQQLCS